VARPSHWTETRIAEALQRDADRRGRPPTQLEWRSTPRPGRWGKSRPTAQTVKRVFGSFNRALAEAGLEVRPPNKGPQEGHPLTPDNVYPHHRGGRMCLTCMRERQRQYVRRARAKEKAREQTRERRRQRHRSRNAEAKRRLYAERKAAGLCACGSVRDVPGRASCARCLARLRARRATRLGA
jgi:hypothetical protein